jgi:hypothetical protein
MSSWIPGRGFVAKAKTAAKGAASQAKTSYFAGPGGQNVQPSSQRSSSSQSSGGYILTEAQQATVGKPWKSYPELVGMPTNFDRSQYSFNNIEARNGSGRRRNVNRGADAQEEATTTRVQDDNPLSREWDLRPPQTAIGAGPEFDRLNAGDQPAGALGSGSRVHATYEKTPRVIPQGPQSRVTPMGELGMGLQPKTAAAAPKRGMAQVGLLRTRRNINDPEQGQTPASMT